MIRAERGRLSPSEEFASLFVLQLQIGQREALEAGGPGRVVAKLGLEIGRLEDSRSALGLMARRSERSDVEIVGEAEPDRPVAGPAHLRHLESGLAQIELDLGARAQLLLRF